MVLIYFFVPETKLATTREDKKRTLNYISLEELNQIFTVRTRDCRRYYINHVALRKIHNTLQRFGLIKGKPLHIEDSMHFWSKDRLDRKRRRQEEDAAEGSENTEHGEDLGEKDDDAAGAVHDEGRTARSSNPDAITRADLPSVADTGGSIGFQHEQTPSQPDPDSFGNAARRRPPTYPDGTPIDPYRRYSDGETGQSFGLG